MRQWILIFFSIFASLLSCNGQKNIPPISCENTAFDKKIKSMLNFDVPTVDIEFAHKNQEKLLFLDARAWEEFEMSHIQNARYIGFNNFDISKIKDIAKDKKIIVYCSIGYRSEIISKKLKENGFQNVFNLYGSIFEWCNKGYPIFDMNGNETKNLHTYNKKWSQYVYNEDIMKKW